MKKSISLFAFVVVALVAQVALAGPGCGGHGKKGPLGKAGIAVENVKDGVKVTVTAAKAEDVQEIQDHFAAMKEAKEKGVGCGCGCPNCQCEKGKCECGKGDGKGCGCGHHGKGDGKSCGHHDAKDGKGCGCGDGKCDCEKGKCDCAKDGKGCGCKCDKDAKDGKGCGCKCDKDAKDGKGCGCGDHGKDGKGCGCGGFCLCGLEGASLLVENTVDGVVLHVAGPDPAKIQKHFEGKARAPKAEGKGGCGCGK